MPLKTLSVALFAGMLLVVGVSAQSPHWPDFNTLQTRIYFGQNSADGDSVSEEDWATFLQEEVASRFPNGLTVLSAYGQGGGEPPGDAIADNTKLLIVVHENTDEAQEKFSAIEAAYKEQFGQKGVFRVDFPARIAD